MSNVIIAGTATGATPLPVAGSIDGTNDYLPIYTASATATQAINRSTLLGVTGQPADLTSVQTVQNKVVNNTNTVTLKDTLFTLQDDGDTTKQAKLQLSGITTGTTRTYTLPDISDTLLTLTATQTLTNKTLTSATLTSPTITNASITADTYSGYTTANTGSIYGISVTTGNISSALTLNSTLTVTGATTLNGATAINSTLSTTGQPSFQTSLAAPTSGASTAGIILSSTSKFGIFYGTGAPTFSAAQGSIYLNTSGSSTSTRLYVNTSGSTTWTNFTSAA